MGLCPLSSRLLLSPILPYEWDQWICHQSHWDAMSLQQPTPHTGRPFSQWCTGKWVTTGSLGREGDLELYYLPVPWGKHSYVADFKLLV